jgi:phosphoribosylformimino-5-aminoimidazole carboxamide ribotide isomerase
LQPSCYHGNTLIETFVVAPAVDVLGGRAVRLRQGDYDRVEIAAGDPLELVRRAAGRAPPFVHVVALAAARDGGAPLELARACAAASAPVPVQLGGGVRSVADALAIVDAGVARVVVGTAAFGPQPLSEFVDALGDRVAVALDVADGIVRTAGWTRAGLAYAEALARCEDAHVGTVVCTAIARDGTRSGPDLELLDDVRERFGGVLFAAGGIRDRADVDAVRALGLDGVVVGRAWLEGTLEWGPGEGCRPPFPRANLPVVTDPKGLPRAP